MEALLFTVVIGIVVVRVLFTETFWIIVAGAICIGISGYLLFWVWIFVVSIMAMA